MRRFWLIIGLWLAVLMMPMASLVAQEGGTTCPGALPSRLAPGVQARVTPGDPNNVRAEPARSAASTGSIPGGAGFTVLDGPVCADGFTWWQVDYNGLIGWTVEGTADAYWLEPIATLAENAITAANLAQLTPRAIDFSRVRSVNFTADGRWQIFSENDGLWVKDLGQPDSFANLIYPWEDSWWQRFTAIAPDGTILIGLRGELLQIDPASGATSQWATVESGEWPLFFSADSRLLVTRGVAGLELWDVASRSVRFTTPGDYTAWAFSPDGRFVAISDAQNRIHLWNTQTDEFDLSLRLSETSYNTQTNLYNMQFSPDGSRLAVATSNAILLFDLVTGSKLAVLEGGSRLAFTPDGSLLLANENRDWYTELNAETAPIQVWEARTGQKVAVIDQPGARVDFLQFSPDGARLYTADYGDSSQDREGAFFEWTIGPEASGLVQQVEPRTDSCPGFLASRLVADGRARVRPDLTAVNLRAQPTSGSTQVGQVTGGTFVDVVQGPSCTLGTAWWQVSAEGQTGWLAEGQADAYWLLPVGIVVETPAYPGDPLAALGQGEIAATAISPDGAILAVSSTPGVWLYDLNDLDATPRLLYLDGQPPAYGLVFSPDSTQLAVAAGSSGHWIPERLQGTWLWDVATATLITRFQNNEMVGSLAFNPAGTLLASAGASTLLWDVQEGYESGQFTDGALDLAFSPDGRILVSVAAWSCTLWNVERRAPISTFWIPMPTPTWSIFPIGGYEPNPIPFDYAALSPDGQMLASYGNGRIQLWNGAAGNLQTEIYPTTLTEYESWDVSDLAFSPDGTLLASSGDKLRLWDMTFSHPLVLQAEIVTAARTNFAAFSPDGGQLLARVVVSQDESRMEVWDVAAQEQVWSVPGIGGQFTPDGRIVTFTQESVEIRTAAGELEAQVQG